MNKGLAAGFAIGVLLLVSVLFDENGFISEVARRDDSRESAVQAASGHDIPVVTDDPGVRPLKGESSAAVAVTRIE